MTLSEFPRILVVTSHNFNLVTGGGITLTNLFRGWPADRIANLHEDSTPEDKSVCHNFYRLSEEEIHWAWPFSIARPWYKRAALATGVDGSKGSLERERISIRLARQALGDGVPRTAKITTGLRQWLNKFQPEIIYSFLGSMAQIRLTRELGRSLCIPIAIHIMDDWPMVVYRRGLLGPVLRQVVLREFKAILRSARLRLGICQEMCDEYRKRYGYEFLPFHNVLEVDEWLEQSKRSWIAGSPFIVRYVGSVVPNGQREALRDICNAVAGLQVSGHPVEMWVHAPNNQIEYLRDGSFPHIGLRLLDPPHQDSIIQILSQADLLVLPFNFDTRSTDYIRLSMPTKVPAYMASATPVLVYGPPGVATVRYAERDGWGYVVSQPGVAALQRALTLLIGDEGTRKSLGQRAKMLVRRRYDAAKVRPLFHNALATIAAKSGHNP